ncbi:PSD1 and planctomycete cytochrome C domain-containing protein [bacterium]|nr:PSD1 and planctomycete cytochrome C domain-containing protein [bacterium]
MTRSFVFSLVLLPLVQAEEKVSYNHDIRPILSENCFFCHGPDPETREGDVALHEAKFAYALVDGIHPIVPGDSEDSEVVYRIFDKADPMPPEDSKRSLTEMQKNLIKLWIEQGAEYEEHYAFVPPVKASPPVIAESKAPLRNPIDHFIQARLKKEDLVPASEASLEILARRATLALTGLQPTPEQTASFLNDKSPDAYEKFVERLLTTDAYAERMALNWLDVARYADTDGYQNDNQRENWPWRDWVIQAYRENMPFDQFTIEQLAGDMLPDATEQQRLATAFNRNHRQNGEGGALAAEYFVENVIDRVETTSTVWLGLTTGCARCHDHKYDPISQKEFFQLYGYFNNIGEKGIGNGTKANPLMSIGSPLERAPADHAEKVAALDAAVATAEKDLPARFNKWVTGAHAAAIDPEAVWFSADSVMSNTVAGKKGSLKLLPDSSFRYSGKTTTGVDYNLKLAPGKKTITGVRLIALPDPSFKGPQKLAPSTNGNFVLTSFEASAISKKGVKEDRLKIARASATFEQKDYPLAHALDSNNKTGWAISGAPAEGASALFVFDKPLVLEADGSLELNLRHGSSFAGHNIGRFQILLTSKETPTLQGSPSGLPAALIAILKKDLSKGSEGEKKKLRAAHRALDLPLTKAISDREKYLKGNTDKVPVMVMKEREGAPAVSRLLDRGQYDAPIGEPLSRGVLAALLKEGQAHPKDRLELAKWLVSRDNPITARVVINRMWQQLMGIGLVKTAEDFGSQGELPSHPALLDWLAIEFIESGWDVNKMMRLIATSHTFRQSSVTNSILIEKDPENRLRARGPRHRMDGFAIRDLALHAAGLLNSEIGGRPVKPYQPAGLWQSVAANAGTRYKESSGKDLYRKSMYSYWKRAVNPPRQIIFDAGSREICNVKPKITNTPLQALALMNDRTFLEAARHLAERMLKEAPGDPLPHGYRLATGYELKSDVAGVLEKSLTYFTEYFGADENAAVSFLKNGASKRDESISVAQHAAYTAVAHLILNLDETITIE